MPKAVISLSVGAYTHKKIKIFRSCVSHYEAFFLRCFFFLPVFMRKIRKVFVVRMRIKLLFLHLNFLCFMLLCFMRA